MKIGFAREIITPKFADRMAGFDRRTEPSVGTLDDLYASCVAMISDAGERAAFCVLDVLGTDRALSRKISEAVDADGVWVSATHTHSAPSSVFTDRTAMSGGYREAVVEKCRLAAERAFAAAKPAVAGFALSSVTGIASVRNVLRGASAFEMPLAAFRFETEDGPVSMVRYQCHPTVLNEKNLLYSKDILRGTHEGLPGKTLFMNGACADLSTRYTRRASTPEEALRIGLVLADAVKSVEFRTDEAFGRTISIRKKTLELQRGPGADAAERERLAACFRKKSAECEDENERREYDSILCLLARGDAEAEPARPVDLTVADFGTAVLAGLPFEVRHDDALRMEKTLTEAAGRPVWLAAYCGGYDGYLAGGDKLSENSSYEDFASRYLPGTHGRIADALQELIGGK